MARIPSLTVGKRLRLARETMGLDARELGELVGVSASAVTSWERGRTEPSLGRVELLAQVLDVDESWLAWGKVPVPAAASLDLPTSRYPIAASRRVGAGRRPGRAWAGARRPGRGGPATYSR